MDRKGKKKAVEKTRRSNRDDATMPNTAAGRFRRYSDYEAPSVPEQANSFSYV